MTQITKGDALLAIDAAMAALASARVLVDAIGEEPTEAPTGGCKHLRVAQTFGGALCRDCGEPVVTPGEPDSAADTPVGTIPQEEAQP